MLEKEKRKGLLVLTRPVTDTIVENVSIEQRNKIGFTKEKEDLFGCSNAVEKLKQEIGEKILRSCKSVAGGSAGNMVEDMKLLHSEIDATFLFPYKLRDGEEFIHDRIILKRLQERNIGAIYCSENPGMLASVEDIYVITAPESEKNSKRYFISSEVRYTELNDVKIKEIIQDFDEILVEMYTYFPNKAQLDKIINLAIKEEKKVTFALSGKWVIEIHKDSLEDFIKRGKNIRIVGNDEEVKELFGEKGYKKDHKEMQEFILNNFPNLEVFETLGDKGGRFISAKESHYTEVIPYTEGVANTNGAGDASYAGFVAGERMGFSIKESLEIAMRAGFSVLNRPTPVILGEDVNEILYANSRKKQSEEKFSTPTKFSFPRSTSLEKVNEDISTPVVSSADSIENEEKEKKKEKEDVLLKYNNPEKERTFSSGYTI